MVKKRVGRRNTRANPIAVTIKRRAPSSPRMMPARTAKMATEIVRTRNRPRGTPERAIWDARKDCD